MKKLLLSLILVFCLVQTGVCAELLIKANGHWMDNLSQEKIEKMSEDEFRSYNARSQKGDVIAVRPDVWTWGKSECPPNYIVVKVPEMTLEETKEYEQPLMEDYIDDETKEVMQRVVKLRKYYVDVSEVEEVKQEGGIKTRTKTDKIKNIKVKSK